MVDQKTLYAYFFDAKKYETEHSSLTGGEIKKKHDAPDAYQLFLEEEGDTPDKPISDGEAVSLEHKIKHFYAVPPATFGVR